VESFLDRRKAARAKRKRKRVEPEPTDDTEGLVSPDRSDDGAVGDASDKVQSSPESLFGELRRLSTEECQAELLGLFNERNSLKVSLAELQDTHARAMDIAEDKEKQLTEEIASLKCTIKSLQDALDSASQEHNDRSTQMRETIALLKEKLNSEKTKASSAIRWNRRVRSEVTIDAKAKDLVDTFVVRANELGKKRKAATSLARQLASAVWDALLLDGQAKEMMLQ